VTSKSGLTYQVGQLEKAGFVRRCGCPNDERGIVAVLTEAGWRKLREAAPGHAALVRELFVDGMSRKDFAALADGLGALHENLRDRVE
jgi:DNA-binding MarR family transcriptional regulator